MILGCWVVCWLLIWAAISCKELAQDPAIGRYGGISWEQPLDAPLLSPIPVGMGMLENGKKPFCLPKGFLQAYACFLWESSDRRSPDVRCFSGKTAFRAFRSGSCGSSGLEFSRFPDRRNDPWVSGICNGDPQCGYYKLRLEHFSYMTGSAAASA